MADAPAESRSLPPDPRAPNTGLVVLAPLAVFGGLLTAYLATIALLADLSVLWDDTGAPQSAFRFNLVLMLVMAYTVGALLVDRRACARDLDALRRVVDAPESQWTTWRQSLTDQDRRRTAWAIGLGFLVGSALDAVGLALGTGRAHVWFGHLVLSWLLNAFAFALLGLMAARSLERARVFSEMGLRARVRLLDLAPLAPFARAGLRGAIFWLLGSSIGSLLTIDAGTPRVVAAVLVVTLALGLVALLRPNLGIHQRLREARSTELAWVRRAIEDARDALARGGPGSASEAARLPALLAYEGRVAQVHEWPFDAPTLMRFALFLLLPLGSWLGGALVERAVDAALG